MKLASTTVAVTGGGGGLGSAICRAARARGAAELIVIDLDGAAAKAVAAEVGGRAFAADVGDEAQLNAAITAATEQVGRPGSRAPGGCTGSTRRRPAVGQPDPRRSWI